MLSAVGVVKTMMKTIAKPRMDERLHRLRERLTTPKEMRMPRTVKNGSHHKSIDRAEAGVFP